ncbi:carboxymuconolactone decarboxylase family protein [Saccharospirillum sp. HFRX-1]|uniref:carboxymuconolactone decarboxylase family protein n=1 Tax=unclassified Saccharospirillum TaxID=2633430 RepID=UPI00371AE5BC
MRFDFQSASPGAMKAMLGLESYLATQSQSEAGVEKRLIELVKIRVSQINRCAFCLDMHTKDARALGETEQRIYALNAWQETPFFSDRERAALAWAEATTQVSTQNIDDAVYQQARQQFSESQLVDLTLAIATINAWNRFAVSFQAAVGDYQSPY